MTRILLADDDAEFCALLRDYLGGEGFEVDAVHDGIAAVDAMRTGRYALLVLDVMMPRQGGFDALKALRAESAVPVLMLTARDADVDRIVGLEIGADDYVSKPCNPRELAARIRAILRRTTARSAASPGAAIEIDDVVLRPGDRTVTRAGTEVDLTSTEFDLLEALLARAGRVVSKQELTRHALKRDLERHDRSIDVHVSHLRRKLGARGDGQPRIKTVRGVGYLYAC